MEVESEGGSGVSDEEIKKVLELHKKWLNNEQNGERADLRDANLCGTDLRGTDLRGADLHWADLRGADLREANLRGADLSGAVLCEADLCGADLWGTDLRGADLSEADLRGADLDFSCFPLWCGGSKFKCDIKLVYQLLAHVCTLEFEDTEGIKDLIMPFAAKSHRAVDLGLKGELE